jgi:hypothetical protein
MKKKTLFKKIGYIALVIFVILATIFFWLTNGKLTGAKRNILKFFPYPIALVGKKPILANTYLKRLDLAEKNAPASNQLQSDVLSQIIYEEQIKQVADKYNVVISKNDIDEEFEFYKNEYEKNSNEQFAQELKKYSLSSEEFKDFVLFTQVLKNKLEIWYNKQKNLNPDTYTKIDSLSQKIAQKEDFGQLAQIYSQDTFTKQIKGDTGFLELKDLLPEVRLEVKDGKAGDIKVIPTRYGVSLIKIEEIDNLNKEGGLKIHLRQIFAKTSGFGQWLEQETKNIPIKQIFKF